MNKQEKVGPWPLGGYIPGNEDKICGVCNKEYKGDKISAECLECGALAANEYIQIIADYNAVSNKREKERFVAFLEWYSKLDGKEKIIILDGGFFYDLDEYYEDSISPLDVYELWRKSLIKTNNQ